MKKALLIVSVAVFGLSFGCDGKDAKDKPATAADTAAAGSNSDDLLDKLLNIDRNAPFNSGDFLRSCRESRNRSRYSRSPDTTKITLTGNRSKQSVVRVIHKYIASLSNVYNRRLHDKPYLSGTITVTFAIDEFGKVIYAHTVKSTVNDTTFENTIVDCVKKWKFEEIDESGDTTVVTAYTLTFSP